MSIVDRLIKRYEKDFEFKNIVDEFYFIIKNNAIDMELKDFIKAIKLAEYKNDLFQSG